MLVHLLLFNDNFIYSITFILLKYCSRMFKKSNWVEIFALLMYLIRRCDGCFIDRICGWRLVVKRFVNQLIFIFDSMV